MRKSLLLAVLPLIFVWPTLADVYGVDFPTPPGPWTPNYGLYTTLGYEFTANTAVSVDGLGTWATDGLQLAINEPVGLWNSAGNLLASTILTPSDPVTVTPAGGTWVFAAITPVALTAGDNYYVGSVPAGYEYGYFASPPGFTVDPSITYVRDAYDGSNGLASVGELTFPSLSEANFIGWFGGNVELSSSTVTPEPAFFIPVVAGLGLIAFKLKRRRRTHA
jgi:hypothetical protein